jgi:hypothetical protein
MCLGQNVADVVLIFGSVDIVLGEVDQIVFSCQFLSCQFSYDRSAVSCELRTTTALLGGVTCWAKGY